MRFGQLNGWARLARHQRSTFGGPEVQTVDPISGDGHGESDTSRDALRAQYAALRRIPVWRRLQLMDQVTLLAQNMAREGLRRRNPGCTDEELEVLYFEMTLGSELAAKVLEHRRQCRARKAP